MVSFTTKENVFLAEGSSMTGSDSYYKLHLYMSTPAGLGTFLGAGGCQLWVAYAKPFQTSRKY